MGSAHFNYLEIYAASNSLVTREFIVGLTMERCIGARYNNPSFGFGGYFLPKVIRVLIGSDS